MALDEPKDTDDIFTIDGFTFIADKEFMERAKPVKIDFIEYGFRVSSSLVFDESCTHQLKTSDNISIRDIPKRFPFASTD
jgi:Fe-S cluster assembly iron-binding protein IscA